VAGAGVPADVLRLEGLGYTVTDQFPIHLTTVYELTRETP
jgi:hypothetical protein